MEHLYTVGNQVDLILGKVEELYQVTLAQLLVAIPT